MEDKNYTGTVPGQHHGESVTAEGSRDFDDITTAKAFFFKPKEGCSTSINGMTRPERRLPASSWPILPGTLSTVWRSRDY